MKINKYQRTWLNDVGGASNWMGDYCADYLNVNPDLPKENPKIVGLKELTSRQRLSIDALLETQVEYWEKSAYVYQEWAYATGALKAFRAEDYVCSLIHRYITSKDIDSALRKG